MNTAEILELIQRDTELHPNLKEGPMDSLEIPSEEVFPMMKYLKENKEMDFNTLMSQTALHEGEELVLYWHLFSYTHQHELTVEARVSVESPKVASVTSLWKGANWLERETYDLLGVEFDGHPDLKRIMLPQDWVGHPLRKDYVNPGNYNGLDNSPSEISQSFQPKGKKK